jgi:hypothetical protein
MPIDPIGYFAIMFGAWLVFLSPFIIVGILAKKQKEVWFWVEDAIELEDYAIYSSTPHYIGLRVDFEFNGESLSRESTYKRFSSYNESSWRRFDNKVISILYSPKYGEVMILKSNDKKK